MAKIDGCYKQEWTEELLAQIIEDDDIELTDLKLVIEQLWEDLQLTRKQIEHTMDRSDGGLSNES